MRRDAKVDANQPEIVDALEAVGAKVEYLHMLGGGCPDILVGFRDRSYPIEIKTAKGVLTDDQKRWHEEWRGDVYVVRTAEEALEVIGAIRTCLGCGLTLQGQDRASGYCPACFQIDYGTVQISQGQIIKEDPS